MPHRVARRPLAHSVCVLALLGIGTSPLAAQPSQDSGESAARGAGAESGPAPMILARQIVAVGYPEEDREALFFGTMDQTVDQMRAALAPTLPADDPGAIAILDEWILEYTQTSKEVLRKHIPDIMAGMEEAYASIFTEKELRDILAFVRTSSGQRYFELSPAIMGSKSFAEANQRYLDESLSLMGPARRELRERIEEHMADQRAKAAPADT